MPVLSQEFRCRKLRRSRGTAGAPRCLEPGAGSVRFTPQMLFDKGPIFSVRAVEQTGRVVQVGLGPGPRKTARRRGQCWVVTGIERKRWVRCCCS